jgi:hypothetical protein
MNKHYSVSIIDPEERYDMPTYAHSVDELSSQVIKSGPDAPYIETEVVVKAVFREYNPDYGDGKLCKCGHSYYRHFDSYENMAPVGCKYCGCHTFVQAEEIDNGQTL